MNQDNSHRMINIISELDNVKDKDRKIARFGWESAKKVHKISPKSEEIEIVVSLTRKYLFQSLTGVFLFFYGRWGTSRSVG